MARIRTATSALGVAAALTLAGCGTGAGAPADDVDFTGDASGTISAWAFDNADDVGEARLDHAEAQLDVEVELDATGFDAQKLTTRFASGDVPDVVQMDRRFVATYAAQDLLVPLDECLAAHDIDAEERWYPAVVQEVRYDDRIWAVPQFYQPPAILVNHDVLDPAGVTPEEIDTSQPDVLLSAIERMYAESGGDPAVLGFDPVATGQAPLWILGMGGRLTDADGRPTLDDPANVAGIELLQRIHDAQGGFAAIKSFSDSFDFFGESNQFVENQVGSQVVAQWYPNVLAPYVDDLALSAVPFRAPDGQPFSVASGTAFVIPAGADNPAAACAWMLELTTLDAWLAAAEARAATLESEGGVYTGIFTGSPGADQAIREQYVGDSGDAGFDQVIATFYEVVDYGETFNASPAGQDITTELNNAVTAALLGEKSPEDALADAQEAALRAYDSVVE